MAHLKNQMDLLTKHLLSGKIEEVKVVESQYTISINADKKANYVNNQRVSEAIAKGIKVETFMISLVINIGSREIGGITMTRVGYMFLLEIVRLHHQVLKRCP